MCKNSIDETGTLGFWYKCKKKKSNITLKFVSTEKQLVGIFTKPLCDDRFNTTRRKFGMVDFSEIL